MSTTTPLAMRQPAFSTTLSTITDIADVDMSLLEADLNFDVVLGSIAYPSPNPLEDPVISASHRGVWLKDRLTHNYRAGDAVVGTTYRPIQNSTIFGALLEVANLSSGGILVTEAGSLKDGLQGYAYLTVNGVEEVRGDPFQRGILATWAHDGSRALSCRTSTRRIQCWNQVIGIKNTLGRLSYGTNEFTIRHTESGVLRAESLHEMFLKAAQPDGYEDLMGTLMDRMIVKRNVDQFLEELFPIAQFGDVSTLTPGEKAKRTRALKARATITDLLESPTNDSIRGTAAALWHSAIEFADHFEGNDPRARSIRALNSTREPFKVKALEAALNL